MKLNASSVIFVTLCAAIGATPINQPLDRRCLDMNSCMDILRTAAGVVGISSGNDYGGHEDMDMDEDEDMDDDEDEDDVEGGGHGHGETYDEDEEAGDEAGDEEESGGSSYLGNSGISMDMDLGPIGGRLNIGGSGQTPSKGKGSAHGEPSYGEEETDEEDCASDPTLPGCSDEADCDTDPSALGCNPGGKTGGSSKSPGGLGSIAPKNKYSTSKLTDPNAGMGSDDDVVGSNDGDMDMGEDEIPGDHGDMDMGDGEMPGDDGDMDMGVGETPDNHGNMDMGDGETPDLNGDMNMDNGEAPGNHGDMDMGDGEMPGDDGDMDMGVGGTPDNHGDMDMGGSENYGDPSEENLPETIPEPSNLESCYDASGNQISCNQSQSGENCQTGDASTCGGDGSSAGEFPNGGSPSYPGESGPGECSGSPSDKPGCLSPDAPIDGSSPDAEDVVVPGGEGSVIPDGVDGPNGGIPGDSAPGEGGHQSPVYDDKSNTVISPEGEGSTNPGSIGSPAYPNPTVTPENGDASTPPTNEDHITPPTNGDAITPPISGDATTPPSNGDASTPPTNGDDLTPSANDDAPNSSTDGDAANPPTNGGATTPQSGNDPSANNPGEGAQPGSPGKPTGPGQSTSYKRPSYAVRKL